MADKAKTNVKKPKTKSRKRWWYIGGGIFLFIVIVGLLPPQGSLNYGLCKTFVELNDSYPQSLEFVAADDMGQAQRISYNRVDPFGQRTYNTIICKFSTTKDGRLELEKVNINGDRVLPEESPENITRFNQGLSALIANPPDLTLPEGLPADIKDYR